MITTLGSTGGPMPGFEGVDLKAFDETRLWPIDTQRPLSPYSQHKCPIACQYQEIEGDAIAGMTTAGLFDGR